MIAVRREMACDSPSSCFTSARVSTAASISVGRAVFTGDLSMKLFRLLPGLPIHHLSLPGARAHSEALLMPQQQVVGHL